jgi:putative membrane protein
MHEGVADQSSGTSYMNRSMLWAAALTLPLSISLPVLAQPAAGPAGTASVPAEKIAPVTPTAPAGKPGMAARVPMTPDLAPADKRFAEKAAEGGMMEVQAGQIAAQKGEDQKVKDFGQKMVTDHTANNAKLMTLAQSKGITLPTALDTKDQAALDKMQGLSGEKFDKVYLKAQISGHEKMLKLMQMEAKTGKDSDLKSFAAATAPTVQEHLSMAKQAGE